MGKEMEEEATEGMGCEAAVPTAEATAAVMAMATTEDAGVEAAAVVVVVNAGVVEQGPAAATAVLAVVSMVDVVKEAVVKLVASARRIRM